MKTLENTNEAVTKIDLRWRGRGDMHPCPPSGYAPVCDWQNGSPWQVKVSLLNTYPGRQVLRTVETSRNSVDVELEVDVDRSVVVVVVVVVVEACDKDVDANDNLR